MAPGMMLPAERGEEPDAAPRDDWRLPPARAVDRRPQHVGVTRGTVLLGERVNVVDWHWGSRFWQRKMLVSGDKGIRENLMVGSRRRYRLSSQERCDEAAVHDLIGAIYNAALEPERWSDVLVRMGDLACSNGRMFVFPDMGHRARLNLESLLTLLARHASGNGTEIGPVDPEDLRLLSILVPHFKRASEIARRLGTLKASDAGKTKALDRVDYGIALLDSQGRVLFTNRAAEAIVALDDGVTITAEGLRAAAPADTAHLERLIAGAIKGTSEGAMRVRRPSLAEPFLVLVTPMREHIEWPVGPAPAAVISITDPHLTTAPVLTRLAKLFDLTATEAKVAASIADGKGLPETAAALRISKNTVHTHLQHIFRKCGVRRQSELVRVLTRATAVLSNAITSSPVGTATPIQHQRDSENGFPPRLRKQTENRTSLYHAQANSAQNALR